MRARRGWWLPAAVVLAVGAATGWYVGPQLASRAAASAPASLSLGEVTASAAGLPTRAGVVALDHAPSRRWGRAVADVWGPGAPSTEPALTTMHVVQAVPGAGAGPDATTGGDGPRAVVALVRSVSRGDTTPRAAAVVAALDASTGAVTWRSDALGDVVSCVTGPGRERVACLERTGRPDTPGRLLVLDASTGRVRSRTPLPGGPQAVAATAEATYVVSLRAPSPGEAGPTAEVSRVDATGTPYWSTRVAAAAGERAGAVLALGEAVAVTGLTDRGREVVLARADGTAVEGRRVGAAQRPAAGALPVLDGEDVTRLGPTGPALQGAVEVPRAADGASAVPLLTRRHTAGEASAPLRAYVGAPDPAPAWEMPAARPLAACAGQLIVAVEGAGAEVRALDPRSGAVRWRRLLAGPAPSSAVCTSGEVALTGLAEAGDLAGLSLAEGTTRWTFPAGAAWPGAPWPGEERGEVRVEAAGALVLRVTGGSGAGLEAFG